MIARMIFKKETLDPKTLIKIGMLCLAMSIAWPRFIHVRSTLSVDAVDGIKGLMLGISLGLFFLAGRLGGFRKGLR